MKVEELIDALECEGRALADAAEKAGPDAMVPTCPEWTVRELIRHVGYVHRWAATYVREARTQVLDDDEEELAIGALPADDELVSWFRAGHAALVEALRAAPGDLQCWYFLDATSPLCFWARRQAHETTIHRADAESAVGVPAGVSTAFAVDGIDELLLGFYARPGRRLRTDRPVALLVAPDDADASWVVRIGPDGAQISRGDSSTADCTLRGSASDLYLALWNRRDVLSPEGDPSVLDLWREKATVRWT
jgi:uncharacterized protein (TIGR03083 family)